MYKIKIFLLKATMLLALTSVTTFGSPNSDPMVYIYPKPHSATDTRRQEVIALILEALNRTEAKYGKYILKPSSDYINELRVIDLLKKSENQLVTVAWLDTTKTLEEDLLPVYIPIQKGIVGYRIFLIRKEDENKFSKVKSIEDLRKYTNGLGHTWVNRDIMELNNLPYISSPTYEGLFHMLNSKRFDYYSRGINEAFPELEARKNLLPELIVEKKLALHYTKPSYLFTSKQNIKLNNRLYEGLSILLKDGTFDRIFCEVNGDAIRKTNLKERTIIKLKSPFLFKTTPIERKELWFSENNQVCM
ncbi:hypothetical protein H0A36_26235 [Endozoicomonas sp. SM1973]|uniref:Solute-binding protein family 3/N-terminal domain-containing protein n=1 Tax=Spartinivicinus marinus TaxID=2994442 RepID=A0A853IHK6_9GAMM|nr:hypothetical protein [Spartinivicinus marinus]NYZ69521.1 hypothetical protein [Spartinivicinus marinus]